MALQAVLTAEELKAIPDVLQKEYVERDGAFYLSVTPVTIKDAQGKERKLALEDVTGLKDALAVERTKVQELGVKLAPFEGIEDPQAAKEALAKVKEWGDAPPDEKVKKQIEATKEQLETRYRGELETLTNRVKEHQAANEKLQAESSQLVLDNAASAALGRVGVLPEAHDMMADAIRKMSRCRKVEVGGQMKYGTEVLDEHGNVRITNMSNSTAPMGFDELAKEMKAGRFAFAFKGTQAAGSGAGSAAGKAALPAGYANLDPVERLKAARRAEAAG
jgi:hypothetical protein